MRLFFFALLFLLSACATTSDYTQSGSKWRGKSATGLLAQKGMADQTIKTADGRTIYTYFTGHYENIPYPSSPNNVIVVNRKGQTIGTGVPSPSRQVYVTTCTTTVVVDKTNRVVSSTRNGVNCES